MLKLHNREVGHVDMTKLVLPNLHNVSKHEYDDTTHFMGNIENMRVKVSKESVEVSNSLSRLLYGHTLENVGLIDNKRALEKLSDILRLPMGKANLKKLHFAYNIILEHNANAYLDHFGNMPRYSRFRHKNGIYYTQTNGKEFLAYNKIAKAKRQIPADVEAHYYGKGLLRLEDRYQCNLPKLLRMTAVTGSHLHNPDFFLTIVSNWHDHYKKISKNREVNLDMSAIKTKKQYQCIAVLEFVASRGGVVAEFENIQRRQQMGELSNKQAHDMRALIIKCSQLEKQTSENTLIMELDGKIDEAFDRLRAEIL